MMNKYIALLFLARDIAHREHLAVTGKGSYAKHMALQAFYEGIVELTDALAEAYQGLHGVIKDIPLMENEFPKPIDASLKAQLKWLLNNRFKAVEQSDTAIQNIIDEIVALYLTTIYKITHLE